MNAFFVYLKLELKRACKTLPFFLAGAIVLVALLGTIAFSASKVLYGKAAIGRISVGVALPEDDKVAEKAMSMITSLESVESICDFIYLEEEEGRKKLQSGEIYVLMVVPDGFVQDIMHGINTPVTIILPNQPGMEAMIFKAMADAGAKTLSVAQAAIYGTDEFLQVSGMVDSIQTAETGLNRLFMKYALPRGDYFRNRKVSATGDVSMIEYYAITSAVLLLLLCGIPASSLLKPEKPVLRQKLKMIGITRWKVVFTRFLCVTFLLLIVLSALLCVLLGAKALDFQGYYLILLFINSMAVAAMVVFAYELAGSQMAGVMLVFLAAMGMMFISGGFIPTVFLPKGIAELSRLMPTTVLIQSMKLFLDSGISAAAALQVCLMTLVFYLAAVFVRK